MEQEEKLITLVYKLGCTKAVNEIGQSIADHLKTKGGDMLSVQEILVITNNINQKINSGEMSVPSEVLTACVEAIKK